MEQKGGVNQTITIHFIGLFPVWFVYSLVRALTADLY